MKAPFPWFGGKSRVSHLVWERFGDVPNYVEPFAGSLAVLLGRPTEPRTETVNDLDCHIANFWRAVQHNPATTATWADWPVNEADLHARHRWLVDQVDFRERMKSDPEFYDCRVAGWWVWGICQWIGSGWCSRPEWRGRGNASCAPRGITANLDAKRPQLKRGGNGVHRGIHAANLPQQLPDISARAEPLLDWFFALQDRLRRVRVCCGDWQRILGPSPTTKIGVTGVFLDPPYAADRSDVYNEESRSIAHDVAAWARENGDNFDLRIALCGYEGEHQMPDSWERVAWKAPGGYGNQGSGRGRENARLERIWFSPHCLQPVPPLFASAEPADKPREFMEQLGAQDVIYEELERMRCEQ